MSQITKEQNVSEESHIYQVRQGRYLYFSDPSSPGVDKAGNVWAHPTEYVDATHPVLRQIIKSQTSKVRRLKPDEVVPKGSIFHTEVASPMVAAAIRRYDTAAGKATPKVLAEDFVVGDHESGDTAELVDDPVEKAKAAAAEESEKEAPEKAQK